MNRRCREHMSVYTYTYQFRIVCTLPINREFSRVGNISVTVSKSGATSWNPYQAQLYFFHTVELEHRKWCINQYEYLEAIIQNKDPYMIKYQKVKDWIQEQEMAEML